LDAAEFRDSDGDGFRDADEQQALPLSDPLDAQSFPVPPPAGSKNR